METAARIGGLNGRFYDARRNLRTDMAFGANVAVCAAMSFAAVVDRVRGEFVEMPGLELTLAQAVRLWTLGADDCRFVIDALVDVGFLKWTPRRTIVRTGRDLQVGPEPQMANILVRRQSFADKSVQQQQQQQ